MHTRRDADAFPVLNGFVVALEGCHHQHVAVVASDGLAEGPPAHAVLAFGVSLQHVQVPLNVRVGVRVAVRQVGRVLVVLERALPGQRIVVASVLALHRVLVVADVGSRSDPSPARLLAGGFGVHERPHAVVVERVGLDKVDDIEAVVLACFGVGHAEVVPLSIPSGVVVRLQDEIVLVLVYLDGPPQVSTLKPAFKQQSVVFRALGHVERHNLSFRGFSLLIGRRVDGVVHDSVHEVLLVSDSVGFSPEALFQDELLGRV
mmetsp:Transcript_16008/g.24820  ORF Transcript_16008/g.24820 Transcript_16008/m.24820 type:complete len:261 (-) Transcript_16008:469-1251(-)